MNKLRKILNLAVRTTILYLRSNYKTIIFNYHYLPLRKCLYLPIKVDKNTVFHSLKGAITIPEIVYPSMIKIGCGYVGIFDKRRERTIWENSGNITFCGTAHIGHGSKISVAPNAKLILGDNFMITAESTIICAHHICFKKNVLISWDVLIMDTDFHKIYNSKDLIINEPELIEIEEHCWIGCRSLILKGSKVARNSVIGAGTIITSQFKEPNTIIAKNPATVIMHQINWNK